MARDTKISCSDLINYVIYHLVKSAAQLKIMHPVD